MKKSILFDFIQLINILQKKELFLLLISFILSLIIILIEMVGISIIPISIINYLDLNQTVFNNIFFSYIKTFDFKNFLIIICVLFFLKSIFTYIHQLYDYIVIKRIRIQISNYVYSNNLNKSYLESIKTPSSQKIWLMENATIFAKLISTYLTFFKSILLISVISIIILLANINFFAYFYLLLFFLITVFYYFFKSSLENAGKSTILHRKDLQKIIQETFEGLKNIIIYNQFNFFLKNFKNIFNTREKYAQKAFIISQFPANFLEFIAVIFFCSFVYISFSQGIDKGNFIYSLGLVSYGSIRIISFVKLGLSNYNNLKEKRYAINLILNEYKKKNNNTNERNFLKFNQIHKADKNIIEIKNLKFKFEDSKNLLFNQVNLNLTKDFYVIKGESGVGKSTMLDILMGIIKPDSGEVKYNILNPKIGYVSQECFIINDSIKKNIAFGVLNNEINDNKILEKLKMVNLSDHISKLEKGLNTELINHGLNLSVGQKQRIGIARALYFEPDVLFLDEPTSSVDNKTEFEILNTLKELSKSITIIMVSHKENLDFLGAKTLKLENSNITQIN